MMIRLFRTEGDGGGSAAAPATGADAVVELLTPKPAGQPAAASGPGAPQPAGAPTVDPAKPEAGKAGDQAGSEKKPDRLQQLEQTRFLGQLQNENAELRKKIAAAEAAGKPAVTPAATPAVKAETSEVADDSIPFDGRTYRAKLLADPDVKQVLADIEEEQGVEAKERELRRLILTGKLAHDGQQTLLKRTERIETENMMAAVNAEFSNRHPELANDTELQTALDRIENDYNEKAQNGQLDTLTVKEMFFKLAQLEFLPQIIEAQVAAKVKEGVERELARLKSGGTTGGGGAPGSQPGAGTDNEAWKRVLNLP